MATPIVERSYAFNNSSAEAVPQFAALQRFLDPITTGRLAPPVVRPGDVCWELGAGGGSIARFLSGAVGQTGRVIATDLDPCHLTPGGNLTVLRHDVRTGVPDGGPFNVIHARCVLIHLPERRTVLRSLIDSLVPGGWLVIEELVCAPPPRAISWPAEEDAKLFDRVLAAILDVLEDQGVDRGWARQVHPELLTAGLVAVDTITHAQSWTGGSPGSALYDVNARQLRDRLEARGLTGTDLAAFHRLMRDPAFNMYSYEVVATRGRKPLTAPENCE